MVLDLRMFTGIVEEIGVVKAIHSGQLHILASEVLKGTVPGDSISVNGTCLTATTIQDKMFIVDVMPETLRRTNIGTLNTGDRVNLERAMAANGRFGGHFVQGHIDDTGKIASLIPEGEAVLMKVEASPEIMRYVVKKGFIAVDGVSLTVVNYDETSFTVSLVGFTREHTILGTIKRGDVINLEVDIMAKYAEKAVGGKKTGISMEFLEQKGFLTT